jgi:hypothetical protein
MYYYQRPTIFENETASGGPREQYSRKNHLCGEENQKTRQMIMKQEIIRDCNVYNN